MEVDHESIFTLCISTYSVVLWTSWPAL